MRSKLMRSQWGPAIKSGDQFDAPVHILAHESIDELAVISENDRRDYRLKWIRILEAQEDDHPHRRRQIKRAVTLWTEKMVGDISGLLELLLVDLGHT